MKQANNTAPVNWSDFIISVNYKEYKLSGPVCLINAGPTINIGYLNYNC
jgi:hypothetical protein